MKTLALVFLLAALWTIPLAILFLMVEAGQ
jgi:hypothetical protein